ncbi:MAG: DUF1616 domain-containing protein [Euryarchaeota archaeon]|nr:DUF1616 domain-containing protein [Euryarchaeota archaeon]
MDASVDDTRPWHRFGRLGSDLAVVAGLAVTIGGIQTSLLPVPDPIRTLSGFPLLFLLPGYALVAALFPRSRPIIARSPDSQSTFFGREPDDRSDESRTLVRLTLSVVASIAVSSLVGIALGTTIGFTTSQFAVGLTSITALAALVALARRAPLDPEIRYAPAVGSRLVGATRSLGRGGPIGGLVRLVVIASLLISLGSVAYAVSVPQQGETPTELYLLTENETGELTASGYPSTLGTDEPQTLRFGVRNYEGVEQRFTVVVTIDRVVTTDNSSVVIEQSEVDRFSKTLAPNQWWRQSYEADPQLSGSNLRLTHYLYRGDAPSDPTAEDAYRVTYLQLSDDGTVQTTTEGTSLDTVSVGSADEPGESDGDPSESSSDTTESSTEEDPSDSDDEQATDESTDSDDGSTESDDGSTESDDESTESDDGSTGSDDESTELDDGSTAADDDESTGSDDETTASDDESSQPINESA